MEMDLESGWGLIEDGITKLKSLLKEISQTADEDYGIQQGFSSMEYATFYTTIYNIFCNVPKVPNCYWEIIYDRYSQFIENYLKMDVLPALSNMGNGEEDGYILLREGAKQWRNHKIMTRWLCHLFSYFDRHFAGQPRRNSQSTLPPSPPSPPLREVALVCFREQVYKEIKNSVKDAVLVLINRERQGEKIDRILMKNVLNMFLEIGPTEEYYQRDFEPSLLESTACHYFHKAKSWISSSNSCLDYMLKAEEALEAEKERLTHLLHLHSNSQDMVMEKVEYELISRYKTQVVQMENAGCHASLRNEQVAHFSRMYRLFSRIPDGLKPIADIFRKHVVEEGVSSIETVAKIEREEQETKSEQSEQRRKMALARPFACTVFELHEKYVEYVKKCFMNHTLFVVALGDAIQEFCNKTIAGSTSAEMLALFCEIILGMKQKQRSKKRNDDHDIDAEDALEKVVKVLEYINEKDLFAKFYQRRLELRLLSVTSGNYDMEASMLSRLKQQFGCWELARKMEIMVKDLTAVKPMQARLKKFLKRRETEMHVQQDIASPLKLRVKVLTEAFWPAYNPLNGLRLPDEMTKSVEVFTSFYKQKENPGSRLTWIYSLGTCNVTDWFDEQNPVELIVSPQQASALSLFNASSRLSYSQIKSRLNLQDEDLVRLLSSLASSFCQILNKEPSFGESHVAATDNFELNPKFDPKRRKLDIALPPAQEEKKKVLKDVGQDSHAVIEACIVRIMKSKKVLAHKELVMECLDQLKLRFKPDNKEIKKVIEDLIGKEYMERLKGQPNIYNYVS